MSVLSSTLAPALCAVIGAASGVGVMGIADHFTFQRSLWPRPICPQCGAKLARSAYVPVLGILQLARPCASCQKATSWRLALLVQALLAVLAVLLFQRYGFGVPFLSALAETVVLVTVGVVDLQHRLIPTLLVYPAILFALAVSPWWPDLGFWNSLLGGAVGFGLFSALALMARLLFGEGALGDGDVTLAALIGAICGFPLVVLSLAMGALFGGVGALLLLAVRRSAFGAAIPYGPFLVAGVLYVLVSGNTLHPLYSMV